MSQTDSSPLSLGKGSKFADAMVRMLNFGLVLFTVGFYALPSFFLRAWPTSNPSWIHFVGLPAILVIGAYGSLFVAKRFSELEQLAILLIFVALTIWVYPTQYLSVLSGVFLTTVIYLGAMFFSRATESTPEDT